MRGGERVLENALALALRGTERKLDMERECFALLERENARPSMERECLPFTEREWLAAGLVNETTVTGLEVGAFYTFRVRESGCEREAGDDG
jgi:hypothetical protein